MMGLSNLPSLEYPCKILLRIMFFLCCCSLIRYIVLIEQFLRYHAANRISMLDNPVRDLL